MATKPVDAWSVKCVVIKFDLKERVMGITWAVSTGYLENDWQDGLID